MPANKSALLRYRIIDHCLTNNRKRYPTLQDICNRIEEQLEKPISESMVNKDFGAMKKIYGAPIAYCKTQRGYHYTQPEFSIREFPLTHEEIDALDFSTALLQQLKGTRMFEQFEGAINKVIEGYRISKILGKSEQAIIQVEAPVISRGTQWLETILHAIINRQTLAIHYQPFGQEERVHIFSPYLLREYRNRWYAVGYSLRREQVIVMALDRINSLETSPLSFVSDSGFNPDTYFQHSVGITQLHDAVPETVVLSFSPQQAAYILSQPLHHSQRVIKQNDSEVVVQLYVYLTSELVMAVLGFGKEVKVLQPESLKAKVIDTAKGVLAIAGVPEQA
ncbi:Predicted DNA-binding transcriptional regulator YafY, contains an HTH and WYL domains [Cnuella takakiae]|uniref:Predicted DNA-binding transcriptional regulator YafY, contains an HTH and WYL domains n=1 Tax=Cnuella takakiae TaxID=1302690 RepID=A0A1M5J699_9BACT|nr:WYL domain-containing protein [Cnuella takakiae]OLY91451.1 hypothetical protein BUE76_05690 [Cnuella takakiae]SHG35523.1 Predicted DNA-binding transcriptional regulator YafY, contains an HTH and WYL domains [Cnuella takakiae]